MLAGAKAFTTTWGSIRAWALCLGSGLDWGVLQTGPCLGCLRDLKLGPASMAWVVWPGAKAWRIHYDMGLNQSLRIVPGLRP
jgi:hypothetical protein